MLAASSAFAGGAAPENTVFELRQYTLYGGKRDTLVDLFEAHFIEPQSDAGIQVVGTFRDLDDPDRFVWIRGFRDMPQRATALATFYGGPVWQQYKPAANATMVDSDNVLLLRPSAAGVFGSDSPTSHPDAMYGAFIYYLRGVDAEKFQSFFDATVAPRLTDAKVFPVATLTTESAPNNFPKLPVREKDRVFLWIARWPSIKAHAEFLEKYRQWSGWRDKAPEDVLAAFMQKPEILRLKPTRRSNLQ